MRLKVTSSPEFDVYYLYTPLRFDVLDVQLLKVWLHSEGEWFWEEGDWDLFNFGLFVDNYHVFWSSNWDHWFRVSGTPVTRPHVATDRFATWTGGDLGSLADGLWPRRTFAGRARPVARVTWRTPQTVVPGQPIEASAEIANPAVLASSASRFILTRLDGSTSPVEVTQEVLPPDALHWGVRTASLNYQQPKGPTKYRLTLDVYPFGSSPGDSSIDLYYNYPDQLAFRPLSLVTGNRPATAAGSVYSVVGNVPVTITGGVESVGVGVGAIRVQCHRQLPTINGQERWTYEPDGTTDDSGRFSLRLYAPTAQTNYRLEVGEARRHLPARALHVEADQGDARDNRPSARQRERRAARAGQRRTPMP